MSKIRAKNRAGLKNVRHIFVVHRPVRHLIRYYIMYNENSIST